MTPAVDLPPGGLVLTLVLLGALTVVLLVQGWRPAGSSRRQARLTADRIARLKARTVPPRGPDAAARAPAPTGLPFTRAGACGHAAANLPSPPIQRNADKNCLWRYQGWRPGSRLARWTCGTCGEEASSLHERHPPVHCGNRSRS